MTLLPVRECDVRSLTEPQRASVCTGTSRSELCGSTSGWKTLDDTRSSCGPGVLRSRNQSRWDSRVPLHRIFVVTGTVFTKLWASVCVSLDRLLTQV